MARLLALALACLCQAHIAYAQTAQQGWAGIVPGSNDYANPVGYKSRAEACKSFENSFVPYFGYTVFGLIRSNAIGDTVDGNGNLTPVTECIMDAGPNGTGHIMSFFGCDSTHGTVGGACVPLGYPLTAQPICDGNLGTPGSCPTVGDPVVTATGEKAELITDYSSGGPYPIEIKRYYRSIMMPTSGLDDGLGLNWRIDIVGRQLEMVSSQYNVLIRREDGARSRFLNPNTSALSTPGPWPAVTVKVFKDIFGNLNLQYEKDARDKFSQITAGSVYTYTDEHDRVDTFNNIGGVYRVVQTVWPGGYQRNYTYDANGHLATISDNLSRTLTLTWTGNVITSIALPDGTALQYAYEQQVVSGSSIPGSELLTQVTRRKPGGALIDTAGYQYDRTSAWTPLLTSVTDTNGVQVESTSYDTTGRALTAQRAGSADATSVAYDDSNGERTVTAAAGQVSTYHLIAPTYGAYGISSIARQASANVPAATFTQAYDANGFVSQRVDWKGVTYNYTNDAQGNETQRVEDATGAAPRTITTTWHATLRLPTKIVGPKLTVDLTYDTAGRLTQRKETDTSKNNGPIRIWNYTWTAQGLLNTVTGPRTDVTQTTTYTYDAAGNVATVKNALNQITTVTAVDAAGRPLSVQDPNGVVTNLTYDGLGRVLTATVQGPTPATTTFAYDVNGLVTSITRPDNSSLTYGYDAAHRLTSVTDSLGNKMAFTLDPAGNRLQSQILNGSNQVLKTQTATFDTLGRLLTSIGAASQTTSYQYDNNGNQTRITDPRNAVTQNAFDALNRLKQVTDPLNGVTQLVSDGRDQITSVTDPHSAVTTYTVNGFGFVTDMTSADTGATTFTYDLAGNVLTRKDARKITTTYTYDALDRPLTRSYPSSTENVTFVYDATAGGNYGKGRLTSLTDAAGTASFKYDAYGNLITETRVMASVTYPTNYAYDLAGNVTKVTYPSGFIVNYQRDTNGQVSGMTTQVNAAAPQVTVASNVQHLPFGPLKAATLGNGVQRTDTYDLDYRLSRTQSGSVQDLNLGYDGASNVSGITDAVSASLSQTFQYDLMGRVKNGTGFYGSDSYTYDAGGNRLTRTLVSGTTTSTTYTITAATNRLASRTTAGTTLSYTYDANGNRTVMKQGNTTLASYTYNGDSRLATAGGESYKYDAFGRRAITTITGGGGHFIFSADGALMAEYTPAGVLVRNYLYLDGQSFALADAAANVTYILNDQVGQPQKMLNGSGAVTWQRVAGIFGDTVSQPIGTTAANPQRFPGQQFVAASGLHYNYYRDYDPATGRYLESDPLGLDGGLNTYVYVDGNPVNREDPRGLDCIATGNRVACTHPNGQTVSFPRPSDWPDKIDSKDPLYHSYDIPVETDCPPDQMRKALANNPTPGSPKPASRGGTKNYASPIGGAPIAPVTSYLTAGGAVINVTLPWHPLGKGYVLRFVTPNGSGSTVHNIGEGTGILQSHYSPFRTIINDAWKGQTRSAADDCHCK